MSAELSILKLFCMDKSLFDTYYGFTHSIKNLEKELKLVLKLVASFYDMYDATGISQADLLTFFDVQYPNNKDRAMYREIIATIYGVEANPEVARDLLEQVMEKHFASSIVSKLIPVVEGNRYGVLHTLESDLKEYISKMRNPPGVTDTLIPFDKTVDEIVDIVSPEGGLDWLCPTLTRTIGPLMRQSIGSIFAYVDSGKTSFGIASMLHFVQQAKDSGETFIYAGNEESAARVAFRMTQGLLRMTRAEILADKRTVAQMRMERGWSRIKLFDNVNSSTQVIHLLETYRPMVLFLDQGTKVSLDSATHSENEVAQLQALFNFYREAAKSYNTAIIVLAQAVGEAENKRWLKLSDMYGSRVSMQGELDYAIGIGRIVDDPTKEEIRFIHVSKNKLLDGATCKFSTHFVKERCQWQEI